MSGIGMTDQECEQLVVLLARYVTEYPESAGSAGSVRDIAEDCAMSMDVTSDAADEARRVVEAWEDAA